MHNVEEEWTNWKSWDPINKMEPKQITLADRSQLHQLQAGVVIHHEILEKNRGKLLQKTLEELGFSKKKETETHSFFLP